MKNDVSAMKDSLNTDEAPLSFESSASSVLSSHALQAFQAFHPAYQPPLLTWVPAWIIHPAAFVHSGAVQGIQAASREQSSSNEPMTSDQPLGVTGITTDFDPSRQLNPTLPLILYPILVLGMLPWMHHSPGAPSYTPPPGYHAPYTPYGYHGAPPAAPSKPNAPWFW